MGLFSRKKVAKRLDLTPARVSQMATSGALIAPIEDADGTERGWPGTYVEEVAARRQGRQTSRSIYGYSTQATPFARVNDAVIEDRGQRAFVQLLQVDSGLVGLITQLRSTIERDGPYLNSIGDRVSSFSSFGTDLLPFIHEAARVLGVDEYSVAWVRLDDLQASEVVVITEPIHRDPSAWYPTSARGGQEEEGQQESIPWSTLHAKLGAPVPVLDVPTVEAVDSWHRSERTHSTVVVDVDDNYNRATAASLLAHLASREGAFTGSGWATKAAALKLAITRLEKRIDWDASGANYRAYLPSKEAEHVAAIATTQHPVFDHLRTEIAPALLDEATAPRADRQEATDVLGRLHYAVYGPFGEKPTPALAHGLERALDVMVHRFNDELITESYGDSVTRPVFYELRTFERRDWANSWNEYLDALEPAPHHRSPDARLLKSKAHDHSSSEQHDQEPQILIDGDDNYVLTQDLLGYQERRFTRVTVVVPIAHLTDRPLDHLKEFDELIVESDTQDGPIMLSIDGKLHLMPFGTAHPGGFTHGYWGNGPSNLSAAITAFLEWASGSPMTPAGSDRIRGIVVGADQDRQLRISRGQLFKPGMFETE